MVDFPWYMGMAPLLAWCLDAVVSSRRFDTLLPATVERVSTRLEFVLRQAFPDQVARGGWVLAIWCGGAAWLLGWLLTSGSWIGAGHYVSFATWTAIFFLLLSIRSPATAASRIQQALHEEQFETALGWLQFVGSPSESQEAEAKQSILREGHDPTETLSATTVRQIAQVLVQGAMVPLFWGLILGAGGALAAVVLQELAKQASAESEEDDFWKPLAQIHEWVVIVPCWLSLCAIQATIQFSSGSRGAAMAGFLNRFREAPIDRVGSAIAYGLDLGPSAGGSPDGDDTTPSHIQRATIILWTSSGLASVLVALAGSLLYRFIL